jgi:hypothetical protein
VNNFLRPFMADGIVYTHDEFVAYLMDTIAQQLTVRTTDRSTDQPNEDRTCRRSVLQNY